MTEECTASFAQASRIAKTIAAASHEAVHVWRRNDMWVVPCSISYAAAQTKLINEKYPSTSWETETTRDSTSDDYGHTANYGLQPYDWEIDGEKTQALPAHLQAEENKREIAEYWSYQKKACHHCQDDVDERGNTCTHCRGAGYFDHVIE